MAGGRCRILVIEDDRETAEQIVEFLAASGYDVDLAADGDDGLNHARSAEYAVMTIDRMLPGVDGIAVIRRLREEGIVTPALIVSALGEIDERVRGLRAGGDDYLVKPFAFAELLARVEALARRSDSVVKEMVLRVGDLELDLVSREVSRCGRKIDLLPREFKVLEYLVRNQGQVVPRAMLLQHVWDLHYDPDDQHHRCLCRTRPPQGRRCTSLSTYPYHPRRRVLRPCSWLRPYGPPRSSWRWFASRFSAPLSLRCWAMSIGQPLPRAQPVGPRDHGGTRDSPKSLRERGTQRIDHHDRATSRGPTLRWQRLPAR